MAHSRSIHTYTKCWHKNNHSNNCLFPFTTAVFFLSSFIVFVPLQNTLSLYGYTYYGKCDILDLFVVLKQFYNDFNGFDYLASFRSCLFVYAIQHFFTEYRNNLYCLITHGSLAKQVFSLPSNWLLLKRIAVHKFLDWCATKITIC